MKKLLTMVAVLAGGITLSGCELNNAEMENIISKCKEDVECKAILDKEIDEALEERGIFAYDHFEDYDMFYELELTDEEIAMLDTLEALEDEVWTTLDNMTDEEYQALEITELERLLERSLTEDEKAALVTVNQLWELETDIDEDILYPEFDTEQEFIEFYLGRALTAEEIAAVELIEAMYVDFDDVDDVAGPSVELTPEQEAALDLIEPLYDIVWDNMEQKEIELFIGRELTEDEINAISVVEALYDATWNELEDDDDNYINETIVFYESVLGRTLTDTEKEAVEFSVEFYYMEEEYYEYYEDEDGFFEDFYDEFDDFFDDEDDYEDDYDEEDED